MVIFWRGDNDYTILLEYNDDSENQNQVIVDFYYGKGTRERKSLSNNYLDGSCFFYSDVRTLFYNEFYNYSPEMYFLNDVSNIYQFRVIYDENGYDEDTYFYNYNGLEAKDKNSIKGIRKYFDLNGRQLKQELMYTEPNSVLPHIISYTYDSEGWLSSLKFLDAEGKDCNNNIYTNYAIYKYAYSDGKETVEFFDSEDNPVDCEPNKFYKVESLFYNDKTIGMKKWSKELDNSYPDLEVYDKIIATIDKDKKEFTEYIVLNNQESKIKYTINQRIDETKNYLQGITYDSLGNENVSSYIVEIKYNNGMKTETTSVPVENSEDIFLQSKTYDAHERLISEKMLDLENNFLECFIEYKGDNRSILFYENGRPYLNSATNYAQANFAYNNNNQLISCDFKDDKNTYINSAFGFSKYEAVYNIYGEKLREKYLNPENKPALSFFGYAQYNAEESFNHKYLTYFEYLDEKNNYSMPIMFKYKQAYSHMKAEIKNNSRKMHFYNSDDTEIRVDFYEDDILDNTCLYDYSSEGLNEYYHDSMGRFARHAAYNNNGECVIDRIVKYTDTAKIFKQYEYGVLHDEIDYYYDGSSDYKSFNSSGILELEKRFDAQENLYCIEYFNEEGEKTEYDNFTYNSDGSYEIKSHKFIDDSDTITYYDKNGQEYSQVYIFYDDNIKRKKVLKVDESEDYYSLLYSLSGQIITVMGFGQDTPAQKFGIEKGDIILEWGDYKYFPKGAASEFQENKSKGKSQSQTIVFYRPSISKFYSVTFEAGTKGIWLEPKYAGSSIEESDAYIQKLHKVYTKWKKKNP